MIISVRVYAALLPRREQYLTSIWREKPFLKFYRLQKLKRVHLNTITAIFTASSAFPQKSSFLILRHCMHGKNNNRATQQRIILGCVVLSYRQRKAYRNAPRCLVFFNNNPVLPQSRMRINMKINLRQFKHIDFSKILLQRDSGITAGI